MNRIDGRVALITGAARGIGGATAQLLAAAGGKVYATDVAPPVATVAAIEADGGTAMAAALDVNDEAAWEQAMAAAEAAYGAVHIVVNNAGLFVSGRIEEIDMAEWRRLAAVNMDGVILGTKWGIRTIKRHVDRDGPAGAIVNLSSIAALIGSPLTALYSMTKAGVHLFSKSAALECGRFGYNIRVNTVHPGVVDTDMARQVFDDFASAGGRNNPEQVRESLRRLHPIGRLAVERDIARAVLFLASDDAGFMTGTELVVDGGYTAQ